MTKIYRILRGELLRINEVILVCCVLFGFMVSIFFNCSGKGKQNIPEKVLIIDKVQEITQDGEVFIFMPVKIIPHKEKIYILDRKFLRVLVFTEGYFSHCIGKPGQEPGEISEPISFEIEGNELYVMNMQNRIEVFDFQGNYIKTIKLNIERNSHSAFWDFAIFAGIIYVSLDIGNTTVQRYDLEGNDLGDFICGNKTINPQQFLLSNPANIYILPRLNRLVLCNQFSGEVDQYDLSTGALLAKSLEYDNFTLTKSRQIKKELESRFSYSGGLEIKTFIFFRSCIDKETNKLWIIPSQLSFGVEEKRNIVFCLDVLNNTVEKNIIRFESSDKKFLFQIFPANKKVFLIDEELNLYQGEIK